MMPLLYLILFIIVFILAIRWELSEEMPHFGAIFDDYEEDEDNPYRNN